MKPILKNIVHLTKNVGRGQCDETPLKKRSEFVRMTTDGETNGSCLQKIQKGSAVDELRHIIAEKNVTPVYQPIVDLMTGRIMGYEALTRGPKDSLLHTPDKLFSTAAEYNLLFPLEQVCREMAIQNACGMEYNQQLFINISPNIISDPNFRAGITRQLIEENGIQPHQITFEITERTAITDFSKFSRFFEHYLRQGYRIAVDDAGAGYSSLQAIVELRPNYIKLDMSIIRDVDKNPLKQAIVDAMVKLAMASNSKIIAEGIETREELAILIRMGVHYAQGYLLARPGFPRPEVSTEIVSFIHETHLVNVTHNHQAEPFCMKIGDIVQYAPMVEKNVPVSEVEKILATPSVKGVVVLENQCPVGLLMKHVLYYKLGTHYGVSLYHRRPVELVMDRTPLIVNESLPLQAVSQIAMSREEFNLYDLIIVVSNDNRYLGVVTIMSLLNNITKQQIKSAYNANPLTGLPGNLLIEDKLKLLVKDQCDFAVMYIDLDNFKAFNDKYGFEHGDKALLFSAHTLIGAMAKVGSSDDFIGHIGGDDFIIITKTASAATLANEIINAFDKDIQNFYDPVDLDQGYVIVTNRRGRKEKFSIMSISVAIVGDAGNRFTNYLEIAEVAADIKKAAKQKKGSYYLVG